MGTEVLFKLTVWLKEDNEDLCDEIYNKVLDFLLERGYNYENLRDLLEGNYNTHFYMNSRFDLSYTGQGNLKDMIRDILLEYKDNIDSAYINFIDLEEEGESVI